MFHYLVEVPTLPGTKEYTFFNSLPKSWVGFHYIFELASLLPNSPAELTSGWIRPKHFFGSLPPIHFYDNENIDKLFSGENIEYLRTNYRIFFILSKNSIKPINETFNSQKPAIVISDKLKILNKLKRKGNLVIHRKNQTRQELFEQIYSFIVELFKKNNEKSFSGDPINENYKHSLVTRKKFLQKSQFECNHLLIYGNENIKTQIRGGLPSFIEPQETLPDEEYYKLNEKLSLENFGEKFLDLLLSIVENKYELSIEINESLKNNLKEFLKKSSFTKEESLAVDYLKLRGDVLEHLSAFSRINEINILLPTLNNISRGQLRRDIPGLNIDPRTLDKFLQKFFEGGRGLGIREDLCSKDELEAFKIIGNTRIAENLFLTYLVTLFSSKSFAPIIKTTYAPASFFDDLNSIRYGIVGLNKAYMTLSNLDGSKFRQTAHDLYSFIKKLTDFLPKDYVNLIKNFDFCKIKMYSDLPFELAQISGSAICQEFPTARYPISPLKSLLDIYNKTSHMPMHLKVDITKNDILFINSLKRDDPLYSEVDLFKKTCSDLGWHFEYNDISESEDFIEILNKKKPNLMIYYGHAKYNPSEDRCELAFEHDSFDFSKIPKINKMPLVTFLFGCETASCSAFMGGLTTHLLGTGTRSILGTLFPIPAIHAGSFLGRSLLFISESITKNQNLSLAECIWKTRKIGILIDRLVHLVYRDDIDFYEMAKLLEEVSDIMTEKELKAKIPLHTNEVEPVFDEITDKHGVKDLWYKEREKIIPYSLFFTSLGASHEVFMGEPPRIY